MTKAGVPLASRSAKGHHSREIANTWYRVLHGVRKDFPDFRSLSFNKLRNRPATSFAGLPGAKSPRRSFATASPSRTISYGNYSYRDFRRVFKGVRRAYKHLAPVFAAVAEPFPADKVPQPSISLGKINRIRSLRRSGASPWRRPPSKPGSARIP